MAEIKPIPDGFHTITPYITAANTRESLDFYKTAFGAEVLDISESPDGKVINAQFRIGDSMLMMNDEFPEYGGASQPGKEGKCPISLHIYVEDADKSWEQATNAGCEVVMPLDDAFWGDRFGMLRDPFGYTWSIATHKSEPTKEEMEAAMSEAFAEKS